MYYSYQNVSTRIRDMIWHQTEEPTNESLCGGLSREDASGRDFSVQSASDDHTASVQHQGRIALHSLFPLLIRHKRNCSRFLINCLHWCMRSWQAQPVKHPNRGGHDGHQFLPCSTRCRNWWNMIYLSSFRYLQPKSFSHQPHHHVQTLFYPRSIRAPYVLWGYDNGWIEARCASPDI